jgi:hypothetical protein
MSEQEWRVVTRFILPPTVLVAMPALVVLQFLKTEEAALMVFVLTRPFGPALLVVWGVVAGRVRRMLRSNDEVLADEIGARSGSEVAAMSYLGIFVPFIVFCALTAVCAIVNASGTSAEVVVSGQVERVNFGRWTRSYSVTMRQPDRTEVTLPVRSMDGSRLQPGTTFSGRYKRGALGILYLP